VIDYAKKKFKCKAIKTTPTSISNEGVGWTIWIVSQGFD